MTGQDVPPRPTEPGRDRDPGGRPRPALDDSHAEDADQAVAAAIDSEEDRREGLDNERADPRPDEAQTLGIDPL